MKAGLHPVETRLARQWRRGVSGDAAIERPLADETPVGLLYDGCPHVVLMATPSDVEDLAIGFTLSERIAGREDITGVTVESLDEGLQIDIRLTAQGRRGRAGARSRSMEGRSSCGLCGVTRLAQAVRPLSPLADGLTVRRAAIEAALDALEQQQALGRLTRAMHAAAFADASGAVTLLREDVGRHNALDKLIGGAARTGLDPASGFAVITSRCSYEMVEKAAVAGFPLMVAISAPTALAIRKAEECGMTLVALARADGGTVFTRPDRIVP